MAQRDPVLIIMRSTRVRRPDGRVVTLLPGMKSEGISDRIKSALPRETVERLKAHGHLVEERPPW